MSVRKSRKNRKYTLVPVYVPVGSLPGLHEFLAEWYRNNPEEGDPDSPQQERVSAGKTADWTKGLIEALYRKMRSPTGRAALRCVAEQRGGKVTYGQMADAAGIEVDQLRAQLAWFSKYSKQVLGGINEWPLVLEEDPNKPKGERYRYSMPKRIAEWWLEAEASEADDQEQDD